MNASVPKLSIILSFRNEEAVLPELLRRLEAILKPLGISYELIFINDASTDQSSFFLEEKAKQAKEIKILHLSRRFGVQASIMAGIQQASGEALITMDADLQDPPELIPKMIEKWQEGNDIVHMVRSAREGENRLKMFLTQWAYKGITLLSETPFLVEAGDFKLLSRRVVIELLKHEEQMPYLRGLVASLGFRQVSLEYRREKRYAGTSHFALLGRGPIETFLSGVISFSPLPLYAIFLVGLSLLGLSFTLFFIFLLLSLVGIWNPVAWIANFLFLLFSLNLTAIGLLGLYLWNILKQTQKRPLYIVDRKINF